MNEASARGPWLPGGEPKPGRIARAALRSVADIARIEDVAPDRLVPATSLYEAIRSAAALEPLTPVGKVYKPALRLDALRKVATRVIDSVLGEGATGSAASLVLDESGPRPTVVVTVHGGDEDARHEKLRAAFRCYEFSTTILSSSAARGGP